MPVGLDFGKVFTVAITTAKNVVHTELGLLLLACLHNVVV